MIECPCKNCITFVICMIQIRNMKTPDVTMFSGAKKCHLLQDYIYYDSKENAGGNELIIDSTRKLFGLGTLYDYILEREKKYETK